MKQNTASIDEFVFRGLLTEESLDKAGRSPKNFDGIADIELAKSLAIELLDENLVNASKRMAVVYTAVAAFENSARTLIANILMEELGENWWEASVSPKIRKRAESRMDDEEKVRWHTKRGDDPINFTSLPDLASIIRNNWERFQPYIHSIEWAASVFDTIERSRNVIMHSGTLDKEDVERVGINIRDWIKQVGA